jgi:probable HAF family extracellular repeat protein
VTVTRRALRAVYDDGAIWACGAGARLPFLLFRRELRHKNKTPHKLCAIRFGLLTVNLLTVRTYTPLPALVPWRRRAARGGEAEEQAVFERNTPVALLAPLLLSPSVVRARRACSGGMVAFAVSLVLAVAAAGARAQTEPRYAATDIGTLGGTHTQGNAINEAGGVGGRAEVPEPGGTTQLSHPFVYSPGAGFTDLGLPAGANFGNLNDINDRLDAAVNYRFAGDVSQPYVYLNGVLSPIALPQGFTRGSALDVNNLGQFAGTALGPSGNVPYVYSNGVVTPLDLPPAATAGGGALVINDRGQVLGSYSVESGVSRRLSRAVLWSNGTMTEIAPPAGFIETNAVDINENGDVLGYATAQLNGAGRRVFIYRDGALRFLPEALNGTAATAINDRGDVVGAYLSGITTRGYLYSDGVFRELGQLTRLPEGWQIRSALDINNAGQILVRAENAAFEERTFVLTPVPEPGAGVAAGAGACGLMMRRRRQRRPAPYALPVAV